nr:hypothetical protein [Mycobacterium mantenii]
MVGDLPPAPGEGPTIGHPSSMPWGPAFPTQPPPRPRAWAAIALAAIAALLGAAALVVALTRPTSNQPEVSSATSATASYTADQAAAAHQQLCDTYKLAARSVQIETNGNDRAAAGVAGVNAAVMLEQAVKAAPATSPGDRAAALALAAAYTKATAMGSSLQRDDPVFSAEVDDVNAKDAAMKKVCGGG